MITSTHTIRWLVAAIALALAAAVITVPSALAGGRSPHASLTESKSDALAGQCPCNRDLPLPANTRTAASAAAAAHYGAPSYCPCNRDLLSVSDNRAAARTASSPITEVGQPSSFHWGDFGIGIATAIGALLMLAGLSIGMRQARQARHRLGSI
jgi:hypothetical protein